jgi:hypothetical protein
MQSRMDNLETLATLGTQDTGRKLEKQNTEKTDHHPKPRVNPDTRTAIPASYKTPAMLVK